MVEKDRSGPGTTRRTVMTGLAAALAVPARAEAAEAILGRSGLGALTGYALVDAASGAPIEVHQGDLDRPPASVAKIVTALYGLERLAAGRRFVTRVVVHGPVAGGKVQGDLTLAGGGDPLVDTDVLGDLAAAVRAAGIEAVAGRFLVSDGALPHTMQIEADQPVTAGYNPTISGMNLNFNRVHLAWQPGGDGPKLSLTAPGQRFSAPAPSVAAELGPSGPSHRFEQGREIWAFRAASLARQGSLWLPVRAPAVYAGEAFRALSGLRMGRPQIVAAASPGQEIAAHESPALERMLRDMLDFSTNLTAEAVGLSASGAGDLGTSGQAMTDWARARYGLRRTVLVNHSGLTARSLTTPLETTRLLVRAQGEGLPGLLEERGLRDANGNAMRVPGVRVLAKTGTLNFVSALAGYIEGPDARRRAFAILAADGPARAAIRPDQRDDPPGAAAWARRARAQEQALLRRWIGV